MIEINLIISQCLPFLNVANKEYDRQQWSNAIYIYRHLLTGNVLVMCSDAFRTIGPLDDCFNIVISDAVGIFYEPNLLFLRSDDIVFLKNLVFGSVYVIGDWSLHNQMVSLFKSKIAKIHLKAFSARSGSPGLCLTSPSVLFTIPSNFVIQALPYNHLNNMCDDGKISVNHLLVYKPKGNGEFEIRHDEHVYLDLLKELLNKAEATAKGGKEARKDRTGTGTFSVFGRQLRFSLENSQIPFITTKRLFFKGAIMELLWFLRGETDSKILEKDGCMVWKENTSRSFLDAHGLTHYNEGDMGPMYGHTLRSFGSPYTNCDQPKDQKKGLDQMTKLIDGLRSDPFSRRHIITTFDPSVVDSCVLAPCHGIVVQFYVDENEDENENENENDGELSISCQVYCRSSDTFLGLPWNIASYAMLTHIVAKKCGMHAKELVMCLGDAHIYTNHVEQVRTQLSRDPLPFPCLLLSDAVIDKKWEELAMDDFSVVGYMCHPPIKAPMAI